MLTDTFEITPRYNEVDRMGYVYHSNYVTYCHQARTELMRKLGICDACLEKRGIIMPVITFDIKYKKAVGYDEPITIKTILNKIPEVRAIFNFEIYNANNKLVSTADSTVVFAELDTRQPIRAPEWIANVFEKALNKNMNLALQPELIS